MPRVRLDEDIKPLSEFRANAAALLRRVQESRRPLVLTQRGHSTAVVIDVAEYERLMHELELLRDVKIAEEQLDRREGIPHEEVKKRLRSRYGS